MNFKKSDLAQFEKFREFCKQTWNTRVDPSIFCEKLKKNFTKEDIEIFCYYFIQSMGSTSQISLNDYVITIISDDPSMIFANIDLNNELLVSNVRKIVEMCNFDLFNSLPVYSEKSAKSALNALIVVLKNNNKIEMKKTVIKLAQSSYFSILISSGRLFVPEKYKEAQVLFKENDPFDCPIFQIPTTQIHLVLSLFPDLLTVPLNYNDKNKLSFFIFAVYQLIILDCSNIKIFITDSTLASVYSTLINIYLLSPSYIISFYLNSFPKNHFTSKNIIKVKDFYSNRNENDFSSFYDMKFEFLVENKNSKESTSNFEEILNFLYDTNKNNHQFDAFNSNIIHDQFPSGILPSYENAFSLLTSKPESISIETLIEDSLHYPAFTSEIANIFMSKLKHKNYEEAVCLANQILRRVYDIGITWISQLVFFPIMTTLYECLNEIDDEYHFEVLFFLFISFYENCTRQGDKDIHISMEKFISKMDEPFRLLLSNFLFNQTEILICRSEMKEDKPIKKLINFLVDCKEKNDIDIDEMIKYPYLFFSAFFWGVKTIHPNSLKLLSVKLPNYKILKRFLIYISSSFKSFDDSLNMIYTIRTSDCSYDFLTRFPPNDIYGIRNIILQHLKDVESPKTKNSHFQGIIISWRSWIDIFTIEKFTVILLETLIWEGESLFNHVEERNNFFYAERILVNVYLNPSKQFICYSVENQVNFNLETNKFDNIDNIEFTTCESTYIKADKAIKSAIWTTLEFVNNYEGPYYDGIGLASFCLLLSISIKYDWKSEFKKVFEFSNEMMKGSNWKSLKYSFGVNFLYISMSILEIQDLINIEMFDVDFLQLNWKFGINFFFVQSEIQRLKKLNLIPSD